MSLNLPKPDSRVRLTIERRGASVVLKLEIDGQSCGSTTGSPWNGEPFTMDTAVAAAERYMRELRTA